MNYKNSIFFLENWKMNSLNFHFHFYEKNEKWILKDWLLKSFSIFSKNENELKFSFFIFKLSEKWIGTRVHAFMKCNTFLYVSCVATSPYNAPSWHFYELYSQPFPQKQVNVRNTEAPCSRFYVTSGLGPCPVDPRSRTKMAAFWPTLTTHGKSRI